MTAIRVFEHRSLITATPEQVWDFHANPATFSHLTMPPLRTQILRDERRSLTEGTLTFRLWAGPVAIRWVARHESGPIVTSFTDRMIEGPLARWEHQHCFVPVAQRTELIDRITYAHRPGISGLMTRLLFNQPGLRVLFRYRHWQTRRALAHASGA